MLCNSLDIRIKFFLSNFNWRTFRASHSMIPFSIRIRQHREKNFFYLLGQIKFFKVISSFICFNFHQIQNLLFLEFESCLGIHWCSRHNKARITATNHQINNFCSPFQHLLSERMTSLGQQMLERWAKIGCENATVGKNGLNSSAYEMEEALPRSWNDWSSRPLHWL